MEMVFLYYKGSYMNKSVAVLELLDIMKWFIEGGGWISGSCYLTELNLVVRNAKNEICYSL